jgi:hypothetical protein
MRSMSKEHSTSQRMCSRTPGASGSNDLSGKQRLQQALFPRGVTFDNSSIANPRHEQHFLCDRGCSGTKRRVWLPPRDSNPDSLLQRQVS